MGQKANPNGLRLGIVKDWDASWFSDRTYGSFLLEDFKIRNYLKKELFKGGVARIVMKRKAEDTEAVVYIARPGVVFGRNSVDTSYLTAELKKMVNKTVRVSIV